MENELKNEKKTERNIYGSFSLAGTEFALSVKSIQEVINEPDSYNPMPLAPDYLLGLFSLRGMIIPVVDLRKIFAITQDKDETNRERKIAIVEHGEYCVGLLFDSTGEVFNGDETERSQFNSKNEGIKDIVVQGVFKLEDGKRLIQILDPHEILNLKQLPKSEDQINANSRRRKVGKKMQCISFHVGKAVCAIAINAIQEIIEIKEIKNTALSGGMCLGAVDIRGSTIPVIDFSNLLGYGKTPEVENNSEGSNKIIVMRIEDEYFGLLVKSIETIISYFKEDLIAFPVLGDKKKEIFEGCISFGQSIETILLNHNRIFSSEEIAIITKGHSDLYKEKTDHVGLEKESEASKKSYITFTIKNNYALEISEVREVIDHPKELIQPPNLTKYFRGMINLRGDLIAVIDPRILYGMDNSTPSDTPKILIFKSGETTYGLIVDSVDSIVSCTEQNKVKIPEILYQSKEKYLTEDVKEAVQIDSKENTKINLLILNLASVSLRVNSGAEA